MNTVTPLDGRAPFVPTACPVDRTLRVMSGRWKAVILYNLRDGPRRFNEMRRLIPQITQRMLTQHLRELEADGILNRRVLEVVPPHVEYSLTPLGGTLMPIMEAMADWGLAREREEAGAGAAA
jgi:DNA-binding HxlR family transcriptional regulator